MQITRAKSVRLLLMHLFISPFRRKKRRGGRTRRQEKLEEEEEGGWWHKKVKREGEGYKKKKFLDGKAILLASAVDNNRCTRSQ